MEKSQQLDLAELESVNGGGLGAVLTEFAGEIAYGVGYVFGGAVQAYAENPPAWDNGKI